MKKKTHPKIPDLDQSLSTKKLNSTIIKEGSGKTKSDKNEHYVDNEQFFLALIEWFTECEQAEEEGLATPRVPEYIGECILNICQRLALLKSFNQYPYKEEMVGSAIETCLIKLRKFNPKKTRNPFSYFTQCAYFTFINIIVEEDKKKYRKYKMIIDSLALGETVVMPEQMAEFDSHFFDNTEIQIDMLEGYIKDYESRQEKRKIKAKQKKDAQALDLDDTE